MIQCKAPFHMVLFPKHGVAQSVLGNRGKRNPIPRSKRMMSTFHSLTDRAGAIAKLAYQFWEERGCPEGPSEEDWYKAELTLIENKILKEKKENPSQTPRRQTQEKTKRDNQA
jgi:hypothetical protein